MVKRTWKKEFALISTVRCILNVQVLTGTWTIIHIVFSVCFYVLVNALLITFALLTTSIYSVAAISCKLSNKNIGILSIQFYLINTETKFSLNKRAVKRLTKIEREREIQLILNNKTI